jgi:hypothetical protein
LIITVLARLPKWGGLFHLSVPQDPVDPETQPLQAGEWRKSRKSDETNMADCCSEKRGRELRLVRKAVERSK